MAFRKKDGGPSDRRRVAYDERYCDNAEKLECCEHCPYPDCIQGITPCLSVITYAEFREFLRVMEEMSAGGMRWSDIAEAVGLGFKQIYDYQGGRVYPRKDVQKRIKKFLDEYKKEKENDNA